MKSDPLERELERLAAMARAGRPGPLLRAARELARSRRRARDDLVDALRWLRPLSINIGRWYNYVNGMAGLEALLADLQTDPIPESHEEQDATNASPEE